MLKEDGEKGVTWKGCSQGRRGGWVEIFLAQPNLGGCKNTGCCVHELIQGRLDTMRKKISRKERLPSREVTQIDHWPLKEVYVLLRISLSSFIPLTLFL